MPSCAGCSGLALAAWPVWPACRTTGARQAPCQRARKSISPGRRATSARRRWRRGSRGEGIRQLLARQFGVPKAQALVEQAAEVQALSRTSTPLPCGWLPALRSASACCRNGRNCTPKAWKTGTWSNCKHACPGRLASSPSSCTVKSGWAAQPPSFWRTAAPASNTVRAELLTPIHFVTSASSGTIEIARAGLQDRQRSQGGVKVPTGGICTLTQQPPSAWCLALANLRVSRSGEMPGPTFTVRMQETATVLTSCLQAECRVFVCAP